MNGLVYLLIVSVFLSQHLTTSLAFPRVLSWLPELVAGLLMALIVVRTASGKYRLVSVRYMALFGVAGGAFVAGILANQVDSGAVFGGLRNYLRCLPLFLLPWVFPFGERQLRRQAWLVFGLMFIQVPLAIHQRFFAFSNLATGDVVTGSMTSPAMLSIVLISGIAVLFGGFLKQRIGWKRFLLGAGALLIPVAINETTASLFFIPLAFIVPALFIDSEKKMKYVVSATVIGSAFMVAFVTAYNTYYSRWQGGVQEILASGEAAEYLYKGATEESRTGAGLGQSEIGRIDSFVLPFKVMGDDPAALALGRGLGNVAYSFSRHLTGEYTDEYALLGSHFSTLGFLLWETGVIGVFVVLIYLAMLFFDARLLSRRADAFGALGLGWTAVVVLITASLAYKNILPNPTVSFMFALYAGVVSAEAAAMRERSRKGAVRQKERPVRLPRVMAGRGLP